MQKASLKSILILVLCFASILFPIFFFGKVYFESQTTFIVVPKKDFIAENFNQLSANLVQFSKNDSFKEKIDSGKNLEFKRLGESNIFQVSFVGNDKFQAENISQKVAQDLIIILSRHYNIKEEIEPQIIEGPISEEIHSSITISIIKSFFSAIILTALGYFGFFFYKNKNKNNLKKDNFQTIKSTKNNQLKFGDDKKTNKELGYDFQSSLMENKKNKDKIKEKIIQEKKATAPQNLPIADDSIMKMFGAEKNGLGYKGVKSQDISINSSQEKPLYKEATPEEVKERLNRLLSGSL